MAGNSVLDRDPRRLADEIADAHADEPVWLDAFTEALDRRRGAEQLGRVLGAWGLSQSDAARLFGVSRQAVGKWLARGIPRERAETVADLAAVTDLLVHHLKRDRVPAVVRRPAPALGGRSLIDLVAAGDSRGALVTCREMFTFTDAHA